MMETAILYILIGLTVFTIYLYFYLRFKGRESDVIQNRRLININNKSVNERIFRPQMYESSMYIPGHLANSDGPVPTRSSLIMKERLKKEILAELQGGNIQTIGNYGLNNPEMRALGASQATSQPVQKTQTTSTTTTGTTSSSQGTTTAGTASSSQGTGGAGTGGAGTGGAGTGGAGTGGAGTGGAGTGGAGTGGAGTGGAGTGGASTGGFEVSQADLVKINAFCTDKTKNPWDVSACINFGRLLSYQKTNKHAVDNPTKPETVCGWGGANAGGLNNISWTTWLNGNSDNIHRLPKFEAITWKPFKDSFNKYAERVACYFFNYKMLDDNNFSNPERTEPSVGQSATNWSSYLETIKNDNGGSVPSGWGDYPSIWAANGGAGLPTLTSQETSSINTFCKDSTTNPWQDDVSGCINFGTLLAAQKKKAVDPTKPERVCGWGGANAGGLAKLQWGQWGNGNSVKTDTMAKHDPITWKGYKASNEQFAQRVACYFYNNKMLGDSNFSSSAAKNSEPAAGQSATNWTNFMNNIKSANHSNVPSGWPSNWITGDTTTTSGTTTSGTTTTDPWAHFHWKRMGLGSSKCESSKQISSNDECIAALTKLDIKNPQSKSVTQAMNSIKVPHGCVVWTNNWAYWNSSTPGTANTAYDVICRQ